MSSGLPYKSSPSPRSSSPQNLPCKLCKGKDDAITKLTHKLEQVESSFKKVVTAIKESRSQLKEKDRIINDLIAAGSSVKSADGFKTDDHKRISELEASIAELSTICGEYKTQRLKDKSTIDQLHEKIRTLGSVHNVKSDPCPEEECSKGPSESKSCLTSSFTPSASSSSSSSSSLKLLRNRNTQTDEIPLGTCHHCKIVTVDASTQFSPSSSSSSPLNVSNTVTSASVSATSHSIQLPREGINCHQSHVPSCSSSKSGKKLSIETAIVIPTRNEEIESTKICDSTSYSKSSTNTNNITASGRCISRCDVDVNDDVFTQTSSSSSSSPSLVSHGKTSASTLSNLNATDAKLSKSPGTGSHETEAKVSSVLHLKGEDEDEDERRRGGLTDASSAQLAIGIPSGSNTSSVTTRILASIAASASSSPSSPSAQHQVSIGPVHSSSIQQQQHQQQQQQRLEHPSGGSLGASSGVSLFYVNELARKEIELAEARLAAREYECALRELQWQSSVEKFRLKAKVTEYEKVRAQLTQLTAAASSSASVSSSTSASHNSSLGYIGFGKHPSCTSSTANSANILYVKNVLQNFIKTRDKKQQKIMLNALLTALDMEERV